MSNPPPLAVSPESIHATPGPKRPMTAGARAEAPRIETDWTRLLYRDLETPWRDEVARDDERADDRPAFALRRPATSGALLVGIYVVVHLAIAGVMRAASHDQTFAAPPAGGSAARTEPASTPPRESMPPQPRIA